MKNNLTSRVLPFLPFICYITELVLWKSSDGRNINGLLGALWFVGQLGIQFILYKLFRWRINGHRKGRIVGIIMVATGTICYMLNYILGYWMDFNTRALLPAGAGLTGAGMVVVGVQTLRHKVWNGWKKFAPLVVGLYPFVIMFPLVIISGHPSIPAIMCWAIPWLLLAMALRQTVNGNELSIASHQR